MYKFFTDGNGVHRDDGADIPNDVNNRDWKEYLQYAKDGGITEPADPPAEKGKDPINLITTLLLKIAPDSPEKQALQDVVSIKEATGVTDNL